MKNFTDNKTCYVVLDRDMEELIFDTMLFSTYEKALKYVQDTIKEGQNLYDRVIQDDESSWRMQDDGEQPRIIEVFSKVVW
ncbi:hypothetical protein [Clostridium faecium]|uniref:Uncharacterized protein n=1 Tax=Clostridium faecium TaxID=2762223 RepID=A0ABR8YX26_9CLOT|nr:hypothetical protein [Clostridium faecium]MBD8048800.1 hypothetical protein [Clostridium faecium]